MEDFKRCSRCSTIKRIECFSWRDKKKEIRDSWCKTCKSKYHKNTKDLGKLRKIKHKRIKQKMLIEFFLKNPCKKCGENDPVLLECHHLDPSIKINNISSMVSHSYSWEKINLELKKCEILCCNCHRKETAKKSGWQAFVDSILAGNEKN